MIDASFVETIAHLAEVQTWKIEGSDGRAATFTSKPVNEIAPAPPPLPAAVNVVTLAGFCDLIRAKIDALVVEDFFVHVLDEVCVSLQSVSCDLYGRRTHLIHAVPVKFEGFKFGAWIPQEEFVIGVAAKFAPTDDKDYVLRMASCVTSDAMNLSEDDGFSQRATVKTGMKTAEIVTIKPKVELAPFRTFPEVGQPVSEFVFRGRSTPTGPAFSLIEADGCKWKLGAIAEIKRFLVEQELGAEIIA